MTAFRDFTICGLAILSLSSCTKDPVINSEDCLEMGDAHSGWKSDQLKSDYFIQYPSTYQGGYVQSFEGAWFILTSSKPDIVLEWEECGLIQCYEFGDTLLDQDAASVLLSITEGDFLLDQRLDFCMDGILTGIYFYENNGDARTYGSLYLLNEGIFRDGLHSEYETSVHEEVIAILKTISR